LGKVIPGSITRERIGAGWDKITAFQTSDYAELTGFARSRRLAGLVSGGGPPFPRGSNRCRVDGAAGLACREPLVAGEAWTQALGRSRLWPERG
jgi:hypothetical protein